MDDLISRQAAIDALRYAQHRFTVADEAGGMGTVKWSEDVIYFAAAERVLSELPSAQPEPHWIPVTERLPKEDGNYLVSGKWESGKESVGDCEFSVEDGYFQTAWNFDVLAWMPKPEPFKGVTT